MDRAAWCGLATRLRRPCYVAPSSSCCGQVAGPEVLQLALAEAASFPRGSTAPAAGATPWLAVGVDAAGLATYCLRWAQVQHVDPEPRRACVEMAMLTVLARVYSKVGFPVNGNA